MWTLKKNINTLAAFVLKSFQKGITGSSENTRIKLKDKKPLMWPGPYFVFMFCRKMVV